MKDKPSGPGPGDSLTLDPSKPHVTAVCPCGGQYMAGESTSGVCFVLHSMPPCDAYIALEVTPFLRWARAHGARTLS